MTTTDDDRPETSPSSDHSLLQRYRRGSQDAATQLYLRYVQRLRGLARAQISQELARRVDLDDLVQSVFGSFFRGVNQGLYDVPAGEELWKLFLVIALHKIRNQGTFHRAAKRDVRRSQDLDHTPEVADDSAALSMLQVVIDEALEKLQPAHKEVVELRMEGHEVADIAGRTGKAKRTVERLLQQARAQLNDLLDGEELNSAEG